MKFFVNFFLIIVAVVLFCLGLCFLGNSAIFNNVQLEHVPRKKISFKIFLYPGLKLTIPQVTPDATRMVRLITSS